jgi:hypothetical protein
LFCGTRVLVLSPESQNLFLPIPHRITPRNGHLSLVPCRKIWVYIRVIRGKRPVKNPLVSVFPTPECTRCRKQIWL